MNKIKITYDSKTKVAKGKEIGTGRTRVVYNVLSEKEAYKLLTKMFKTN